MADPPEILDPFIVEMDSEFFDLSNIYDDISGFTFAGNSTLMNNLAKHINARVHFMNCDAPTITMLGSDFEYSGDETFQRNYLVDKLIEMKDILQKIAKTEQTVYQENDEYRQIWIDDESTDADNILNYDGPWIVEHTPSTEFEKGIVGPDTDLDNWVATMQEFLPFFLRLRKKLVFYPPSYDWIEWGPYDPKPWFWKNQPIDLPDTWANGSTPVLTSDWKKQMDEAFEDLEREIPRRVNGIFVDPDWVQYSHLSDFEAWYQRTSTQCVSILDGITVTATDTSVALPQTAPQTGGYPYNERDLGINFYYGSEEDATDRSYWRYQGQHRHRTGIQITQKWMLGKPCIIRLHTQCRRWGDFYPNPDSWHVDIDLNKVSELSELQTNAEDQNIIGDTYISGTHSEFEYDLSTKVRTFYPPDDDLYFQLCLDVNIDDSKYVQFQRRQVGTEVYPIDYITGAAHPGFAAPVVSEISLNDSYPQKYWRLTDTNQWIWDRSPYFAKSDPWERLGIASNYKMIETGYYFGPYDHNGNAPNNGFITNTMLRPYLHPVQDIYGYLHIKYPDISVPVPYGVGGFTVHQTMEFKYTDVDGVAQTDYYNLVGNGIDLHFIT